MNSLLVHVQRPQQNKLGLTKVANLLSDSCMNYFVSFETLFQPECLVTYITGKRLHLRVDTLVFSQVGSLSECLAALITTGRLLLLTLLMKVVMLQDELWLM